MSNQLLGTCAFELVILLRCRMIIVFQSFPHFLPSLLSLLVPFFVAAVCKAAVTGYKCAGKAWGVCIGRYPVVDKCAT